MHSPRAPTRFAESLSQDGVPEHVREAASTMHGCALKSPKPSQVPGHKANSPHPDLQLPSASLHPSEEAGNSLPLPRVPHLSTPYLFTQRRPPRALGLLVALGQGAVAGAQSFAGGIVYLHGNPLSGPFLRIRLHVNRLFIPQKVFKPREQLWEFPKNKMNEVKK